MPTTKGKKSEKEAMPESTETTDTFLATFLACQLTSRLKSKQALQHYR